MTAQQCAGGDGANSMQPLPWLRLGQGLLGLAPPWLGLGLRRLGFGLRRLGRPLLAPGAWGQPVATAVPGDRGRRCGGTCR